MLQILNTKPSQKYVKYGTLIALIFFIVFFLLMRVVTAPVAEDSSYDIFDLEFAWDSETTDQILADWGQDNVDKMILGTLLDFGFLLAYGALLADLSLLVARSYDIQEKGRTIGLRFVILSFAAAGFDVIENNFLLQILYSYPNSYPDFAPFLASVCAVVKFTLVILAIGYIIIGFLFKRFRGK